MEYDSVADVVHDYSSQGLIKPVLKEPRRYKVLLLNDDYTPMDFVVDVLQKFFQKGEEEATKLMWMVHSKGQAVCGVYTKDIAETKVNMVLEHAYTHEHPLLCVLEREQ